MRRWLRAGIVLTLATTTVLAGGPSAVAATDPPPVLGGQLYSTGAPVTIEVLPASAALTSTLSLYEPELKRIATNRDVGTKVTIGPYGNATELLFGIQVGSNVFKMGPAARNPDNLVHARVDFDPTGCAVVGFEDLFGGGDRDYDDNVFKFCGGIAADPPDDPQDPPTPDPVAPPVARAGADQVVDEGAVVHLDGSASTASVKPGLAASRTAGTLPGGTSLTAAISGLDPQAATGKTVLASVEVGTGPARPATSIAYVLDVSGSTALGGGCGGDANGDRSSNTVLDCEIEAAVRLHEQVVQSGIVDKVAVVSFSTSAAALDLNPTSAVAQLVSPTADADGNGVYDVIQGLRSLRIGGGTAFVPPTRLACQLLSTTGSPQLLAAFLSDGQAGDSVRLNTILPCSPAVQFQTFAVGTGSDCDKGTAGDKLSDLAALSAGTCTNVPNVSALPNILPAVIAAKITTISYSIDGGAPVDISAASGLPKDGPATVPVSFVLPSDLTAGTHRICLTVTGTDSGGTSSATTCSDLVQVSGALSYSWRVATASGPPVFLSSPTSATPSFVAPDDGIYVLELTVIDGTGGTATDQVSVTVRNVAPSLTLRAGEAFAGGVTQINGSLTDLGWLDTHNATLSWGDGTSSVVDVQTRGAGWGVFFGSHVYTKPGAYAVSVVVKDDDGGTDTESMSGFKVTNPVAVWANSTSLTDSLTWVGGAGDIQGRVHSNGLISVGGAPKTIGETTYAGALAANTDKQLFTPAPVKTSVQPYPYQPAIADYRPGARVSAEVGAAYHDMTSVCADGSWHTVQTTLASGVYYASCDIKLNGSQIGGDVTLVSEGSIVISGSKPAFTPYLDGLFLLAGASGDKAIDIAASTSKFLGTVFAGSGQISVSGSDNRFFCGILGDRIRMTGTNVDIRGAQCSRAESAASPVLVPDLTSEITADKALASPGDVIGYDIAITNSGATLAVPALVGFENVDTMTASVTGWSYVLERRSATGEWLPLVTDSSAISVTVSPNPFTGVTYPTAADQVTGTTVVTRGWATWGTQATVRLTPEQTQILLDSARTSGIRTRVDFQLAPSGVQARRLFTYGRNFIDEVRALSGDARDATAYVVLPGDGLALTSADVPALADLPPGATAQFRREWTVPVPAPRGAGETDAGYLSRLAMLDQSALSAAVFALAQGGVGRLVAPLALATTTRQLPVLGIAATGPTQVPAGTTATYAVKLSNLGSQQASSITTTASAGTTTLPVVGAPTVLAPGEIGSATATYAVPAANVGPVTLRSAATWQDAHGATYGPVGSDVQVTRLAPAAIAATLTDALQVDVGGDATVSPGDILRYTLAIRNGGQVALTGVHATVDVDANLALVPGTTSVPAGGSVTVGGSTITVDLADIPGGSTSVVTFDAVVADPFATGVGQVSTQGHVSATSLVTAATDDPALPGAADPTTTTIVIPAPALLAHLSGSLAVDADHNGVVSPGDTLAYVAQVSSAGTKQVTDVRFLLTAPAGTVLTSGSVTSTSGTVMAGPDVNVSLGTMAPFAKATISFRAALAAPLPAGQQNVVASGRVSSADLPDLPTDDPATTQSGDPTVIVVGGGLSQPDVPGATFAGVTPTEGATLTSPTQISATTTAPPGEFVKDWTVSVLGSGQSNALVLGTGSGTAVSALLDPTKLPNGSYVVSISVTTSNGAVSVQRVTIVIDGAMKLGRFQTTVTDMQVGIGGLPLRLDRSYDSIDKSTGDFGVGWDLGLSGFRVTTNGPLGQGGWSMHGCGSGLVFVPLCFDSIRPHFVTVTWPDGRNEVFDLTPATGSTFFSGLTSAAYTGRPGATSTLTATETGLFLVGDSFSNGFLVSEVYDPKNFVLRSTGGVKYYLTVGVGLTRIEDPDGSVTTISANGIHSSRGADVAITRDTAGRVTKLAGPDGASMEYGYSPEGDLILVKDQTGATATMTYLPGHYLNSVNDPSGRPMARYEYADGRLVAVVDALGNRTAVSSDVGARSERRVSADGRLTTIDSYDTTGNLVEVKQLHDGVEEVTSYAYDADGNLTYRKDPSGRTSRATYVKGLITSFTLPDSSTVSITYNENGFPVTWTDPMGHVTRYAWNANGTLATVTDPKGSVETFTYDASSNLVTRSDRTGRVWNYSYNAQGLVKTDRDPGGNVTAYEYDAMGRTVAVIDPLGGRTSIAYDLRGRRTSSTDPDGRVTRWTYDSLGQMTSVTKGGSTQTLTYDGTGRVVASSNGVTAPTTYTYDANGRRTSMRLGDLPPTVWTYDGAGRLASMTDEVGRRTSYSYSVAGELLTETNPAGGVTRYSYTPRGDVATVTDPLGRLTRYGYDGNGVRVSVEAPDGGMTRTEYDSAGFLSATVNADATRVSYSVDLDGRVLASTDEGGHVTRFDYDAAGRRTVTTDPAGRRTTNGWDAAGRLVTVGTAAGTVSRRYTAAGLLAQETSPSGVSTTWEYDAAGRQVAQVDALGQRWSTTYDASGRVLTQRNPRQLGSGPATTTNTYDQYGRLATTTDALGRSVGFVYDAAGQRTSVTDARGFTWTAAYAALGGVSDVSDPLGRRTSTTYDPSGAVSSQTDARGVTVHYVYDSAGRLASAKTGAAAEDVSFTYDIMGRRATMTDGTGVTRWTYTPAGQVNSVSSPSGLLSYAYDASGLRTRLTQVAGSTDYGYDDSGRLVQSTDYNGGTSTTSYDADGRVTGVTRPNGVASGYVYDGAGRLTGLSHTRGSAVLESLAYTLDADGNVVGVRSAQGQQSFVIDASGALVVARGVDGTETKYSYDSAGNRTGVQIGSGPTLTYDYDAASQLTRVGSDSVRHDLSGNVVQVGATSYQWDGLSRLVGQSSPTGASQYSYDGLGSRVSETINGVTEVRLYDGNTDGRLGQLVAKGRTAIAYGPSGAVAETNSTGTRYPLQDALDSTVAVTDESGAAVGSATYDPFGATTATTGQVSTFGFGGGERSGALWHFRARELDSTLGRYLSVDPVRPGAPGVMGWNPYVYAGNNPTTLVDPSGAFVEPSRVRGTGLGGPAGEYAMLVSAISLPAAPAVQTVGWLTLQRFVLAAALLTIPATLTCDSVCTSSPEPAPEPDPTENPIPIPMPLPEPAPDPNPTDTDDLDESCLNGSPRAKSQYHYWNLDAMGRSTGAEACIKNPVPPGSAASVPVKGVTPGSGLDRGHLIGRDLGGTGADPRNLFPQYVNPNRGAQRVFEKQARGWVDAGKTLYYVGIPGNGSGYVPWIVHLAYASSDGTVVDATAIWNTPKRS